MAKLIFDDKAVQTGEKEPLGDVLVMGAGPAAMVVATILKPAFCSRLWMHTVDIPGERPIFDELKRNGGLITGQGKIARVVHLAGFFLGDDGLKTLSAPDTIFLCVQNQYYADSVRKLAQNGLLRRGQTIIGLSARLGSGTEIDLALKSSDLKPEDFYVLTLCIYFGATKGVGEQHTVVSTRATKASIWGGVDGARNPAIDHTIQQLLAQVGTKVEILNSTLESEVRSINVFCHAQIALFPEVLEEMFEVGGGREYLYRPEPEGFLTLEAGVQMGAAERDINRILKTLGLAEINMLELLMKFVYPVPGLVTDEEIEAFKDWDETRRGKAIYDWFCGRQIDPATGEPHLNAVKLPKAILSEGRFFVPRVPGEDYVVLVLLTEIAKLKGLEVPTLDLMKETFEEFVDGLPVPINLDLSKISREARSITLQIIERVENRA